MIAIWLYQITLLFIGTDGHLKLADFGLSKQIGVSYNQKDIPDSGINLDGLSKEAYQKVQKFLPLKFDIAQQSTVHYNQNNNNNNTDNQHFADKLQLSIHRSYKALFITLDDDKNDSTLLFATFTIEVVIADSDIDPETIFASKIDAIFIDGIYRYIYWNILFVIYYYYLLNRLIPLIIYVMIRLN